MRPDTCHTHTGGTWQGLFSAEYGNTLSWSNLNDSRLFHRNSQYKGRTEVILNFLFVFPHIKYNPMRCELEMPQLEYVRFQLF